MKRSSLSLFVLASLFIVSCSTPHGGKAEYRPPKFKHEYKAEISKLNDEIMLGNVTAMYLCDSVIIIYAQNTDNDNAFQVLSAKTGDFVGAFANSGRGEGELTSFEMAAINPEGSRLYAIDQNSKLVCLNLAKAIYAKTGFVERSEHLFGRNTTMNLHAVSDTTFLHVEGWHDRHFITDAYFIDTLARYRDYPYISERFVNTGDSLMTKMYFSYHTRSAIKPDRKKFVVAAYCGFVMQIFDIGTNSIDLEKTLYLYEPIMDDYIWGAKDCVKGPVDVAATDKYIYVLYGDTPELSAETIRMGVFDWNGKPVDCYTFDSMPYKLVVVPDDSRVYCWTQDEEGEEYLGYFDLEH